MKRISRTLSIQSSPHIKGNGSVDAIMRNVVYALLPTAIYAVYAFGLSALLTLCFGTASCVITEYLLSRKAGVRSPIFDWSATVTGLLYGLTLPPDLPLWMVVCGGVIAIWLGKYLFGGLGFNAFNPALMGRAFLQAAFPVAMTSWLPVFLPDRFSSLPSSTLTFPFATPVYDAVSAATPLSLMKFEQQLTPPSELFMGLTGGSAGEISSLLILLGGAWLVARNMMNWRIPAAILATVAALSGLLNYLYPDQYAQPLFMLFSGGLMLGAVFMATDMVASPMTNAGVVVYGILIGVLVVVIRYWAGMPEGVMYAILLANALSSHIDRVTQHRVFGTRRTTKSATEGR